MTRRLRGVLGIALTWGAVWAFGGFALNSLMLPFLRSGPLSDTSFTDVLVQVTLRWGLFGAVSGAAFAVILSRLTRRGETLESLSMQSVTRWGSLGGVVPALALTPVLFVAHPAAVIGAAVFGGMLGAASA